MAVGHSKVWESLLVAGGIVFAFGIIWGAFLAAQKFSTYQGAIVLIVIGIVLLVISESILVAVRGEKKK